MVAGQDSKDLSRCLLGFRLQLAVSCRGRGVGIKKEKDYLEILFSLLALIFVSIKHVAGSSQIKI